MNTTRTTATEERVQLTHLLEHADWLRGLALQLVQDGNEAEDALQDALLAANGGFVPVGVPKRAWLGGILKNIVRGRYRQGQSRAVRERIVATESFRATGGGATSSAAADAAQIESQRCLLDQVESLPDPQRSAVLARFYEGLPPRKIAQRDGVPVSTINSRIQRGLETLRRQLDAEHGDRRTWAAMVLPLARLGPSSRLSSATVGILSATTLALVAGTWALWGGRAGLASAGDSAAPTGQATATARRDRGVLPMPTEAAGSREPIPPRTVQDTSSAIATPKGPQLRVRVVNEVGEVVQSGPVIGANARVDMPAVRGQLHTDLDELASSPLVKGVASFGNPWKDRSIPGIGGGPDSWRLSRVHRVFIEGPGLAEFEPGASKAVAFFPLEPGAPRDMECTLTLPDRGSVRLKILDVDGRRLAANGTAELVFPGVPHHDLGSERTYGAAIVAGVAEWPNFVTGSRSFQVRIDVPSLGASWSAEGIGPARAGQVAMAESRRPRRSAITARVMDDSGAPMQLEALDLTFRPPGLAAFTGARTVRASSDAEGIVRFELPTSGDNKGPLPPFSIRGSQSKVVGSGNDARAVPMDAIQLWRKPPGSYAQGASLGDVVLRFEPRTELRGRVIDVDGVPIRGAEVLVVTPGAMGHASPPTDGAGQFTLVAPVREGSTVSVSVPGADFVRQSRELAIGQEEVDFILKRGVSFYGQLDVGTLRLPDRAISIVMKQESEAGLHRYFWIDESGAFEDGPVPPGDYTVTVRHQGGQVIAEFTGLRVGDTGRVTDERVNDIRLMDHFRIVRATWSGSAHGRAPQYVVRPHRPSSPRSFVLIGDLDDGLILPTRVPASVVFDGGEAHLRMEDISTIEESIHVAFGEPLGIDLLVAGTPAAAKMYTLRGEPGSGAEGYVTTLGHEALRSGRVPVNVPMPGHYRLHVGDRPRPLAGGAMILPFEVTPIGPPFEVISQGNEGERQTISVSL